MRTSMDSHVYVIPQLYADRFGPVQHQPAAEPVNIIVGRCGYHESTFRYKEEGCGS